MKKAGIMNCGISVILSLTMVALTVSPAKAAQSDITKGRAHVQKAAALAETGDCLTAIKEFSAAYELLRDPVILFNRGECFRKMNRPADALADYEELVRLMPDIPNRRSVDRRIKKIKKELANKENDDGPNQAELENKKFSDLRTAEDRRSRYDLDREKNLDEIAARVAQSQEQDRADKRTSAGLSDNPFAPHDIMDITDDEKDPQPVSQWTWVAIGGATALVVGGVLTWLIMKQDDEAPSSQFGNYKF